MRGGTVWSRADCSKSCIICWTRAEHGPRAGRKIEVSVRTIYRDLDAISAAGIPIYTVQGKGGGIFILPEFVLEKSLLTPQEKEQILMALQGLAAAEDSRTDELLTKLGGLSGCRAQIGSRSIFRLAQKYGGCGAVRRAQKGCFQLPQGQLFVFCGRRRRHCPHGGTGQADFKSKDWYLYGSAFCETTTAFSS